MKFASSHPCHFIKPALLAIVLALAGCSATPRSATPQPLVFADWAISSAPWADCEAYLKRRLRWPNDYKIGFVKPKPKIDAAARTVTYRWEFRARNGFGDHHYFPAACTGTLPEGSSDEYGHVEAWVLE